MIRIETGRARSSHVSLPVDPSGLGLGTGILTAEGVLPVEFLEPGDRIVTYDVGVVALDRVVVRTVAASEAISVHAGVLDPESDEEPFFISARQKLMLRGWQAKAMFGKPAVLVEAARLVDGAHFTRLTGSAELRLFQLVFDDARHLIQLAGLDAPVASAFHAMQSTGVRFCP